MAKPEILDFKVRVVKYHVKDLEPPREKIMLQSEYLQLLKDKYKNPDWKNYNYKNYQI